jgi:hypothetical protein
MNKGRTGETRHTAAPCPRRRAAPCRQCLPCCPMTLVQCLPCCPMTLVQRLPCCPMTLVQCLPCCPMTFVQCLPCCSMTPVLSCPSPPWQLWATAGGQAGAADVAGAEQDSSPYGAVSPLWGTFLQALQQKVSVMMAFCNCHGYGCLDIIGLRQWHITTLDSYSLPRLLGCHQPAVDKICLPPWMSSTSGG